MIYIASPYSSPDPAVVEDRVKAVCKFAAEGLKAGFIVYSPIAHCHALAAQCDLPKDFNFWQRYNFAMLDASKEMVVAGYPGWKDSAGVRGELEYCVNAQIPIELFEPETFEDPNPEESFWHFLSLKKRANPGAMD